MTVPLTPTSVPLPATVSIPADGESVSSASVAAYAQPMLNAIKSNKDIIDILKSGGTINPSANLALFGSGGATININGAVVDPAEGDVSTIGSYQGMNRVQAGGGAAGVNPIPYFASYIYAPSVVTVGCVWQFSGTPPTGTSQRAWVTNFYNPTSTLIAVKDNLGATITTLIGTSTGRFSAIVAYDGTNYKLIGESFLP